YRMQRLDRHHHVQDQIVGFVDDTHSAGAALFQNLVTIAQDVPRSPFSETGRRLGRAGPSHGSRPVEIRATANAEIRLGRPMAPTLATAHKSSLTPNVSPKLFSADLPYRVEYRLPALRSPTS